MKLFTTTAVACLAAAISIVTALQPYVNPESHNDKSTDETNELFDNNFLKSRREWKLNKLHLGERIFDDHTPEKGWIVSSADKNGKIKYEIELDENSVITYGIVWYSSMNEASNSSVKILAGGLGHSFVKLEFTTSSKSIYVNYVIYGYDKKIDNFLSARGESMRYNILEHGERKDNDKILRRGFMAFALEKEPNKHKIMLKKRHKEITYCKFNYTSGEDKSSTLEVIGGGQGQNYVDITFTSETKYFFVYYEIYGYFNEYSPSEVIESKEDLKFELQEASDKLLVLFFSNKSCVLCKNFVAKVDQLAKEYSQVLILKINDKKLAEEYDVRAFPTFVFYKHGREVAERVVGPHPGKVKEAIEMNKDVY